MLSVTAQTPLIRTDSHTIGSTLQREQLSNLPLAARSIDSLVALAPGGASNPKPGILPATLAFNWRRNIPTLYLVAENDASLPLSGMYELYEKSPGTKQMVILRGADHLHFMDNVEELHEAVRTTPWPGEYCVSESGA